MSNDYIKKLNDIEIFYKNRNIGIGIEKDNPNYKLDVDGSANLDGLYIKNASIIKGIDDNLIIQNKSADNVLSINKEKSYLLTDKLGINNQEPQYTMDIFGDLKLSGSIIGKDNKTILNNNENIIFNPDNNYKKLIINSPTMFKSNDESGGIIVGESDIQPKSGSIIVENDIRDIYDNKFVELRNSQQYNINADSAKKVNIFGKVNFMDDENGVSIGFVENPANSGDLYVQKNITAGQKIKIKDFENKTLDMGGDNKSNIILGTDTYIGNLNSFGTKDQATVIGNNLYADDSAVRVANTMDTGYRGIVMDKYSGINFYSKNTNSVTGDTLEQPIFTITNSGQLVYTMPILEVEDFNYEVIDSPVHRHIRKELGLQKVGSIIDFTTYEYLRENKIFNSIKISETAARTFIINKGSNETELYFDTSL
jgi:hypothetical protein